MHYEIDERVGFDPLSGLLWVLDTPHNSITLPRFASQLLEIMIADNQKSLSREHFLDTIWHNNGLSASGNNLNNYISIIRRSLSSLGLTEIIITIPKYGFSFHAKEIIIIEISSHINMEKKTHENKNIKHSLNDIPPAFLQESAPPPIIRMTWISKFSFLFVFFALALYAYFIYYSYLPKSELEKHIGKYENCNIYAIWNGQRDFYTMNMMLNEVKNLVAKKITSCKSASNIYIYKSVNTKFIPSSPHRVVISQCLNGRLSSCKNIHSEIINDGVCKDSN